MRDLVQRVRQEGDPRLVSVIDAKPLPVGGASGDPEARCGRGAGMAVSSVSGLAFQWVI